MPWSPAKSQACALTSELTCYHRGALPKSHRWAHAVEATAALVLHVEIAVFHAVCRMRGTPSTIPSSRSLDRFPQRAHGQGNGQCERGASVQHWFFPPRIIERVPQLCVQAFRVHLLSRRGEKCCSGQGPWPAAAAPWSSRSRI